MKRFFKKTLHRQFQRVWAENQSEHPIRWIELEVTRHCPLLCRHCGSSCSVDSPYDQELSKNTILEQFRKIADHYDAGSINVGITGGEPLVRKDVFEIMAHISEMGFPLGIVTSGYTFTDTTINYLAAAGVRSVSVSLDGLEDTHDWVRRRPQAFRRAVQALQALVDSGLFYVEPITTVNRRNIQELEQLEQLVKGIGVHAWRLFRTFPRGRAEGDRDLLLTPEEFRYMLDFIRERFYPGSPAEVLKAGRFKVQYCEEGYLEDYELEVRDQFRNCAAGVNFLTILADGSVTGCAALSEQYIQGNILREDIIDLWENRFERFRDRSWTRVGQCADCKEYTHCQGDGLHLWDHPEQGPAICNYRELQKGLKSGSS